MKNLYSWIFFAPNARPTFTQRALAERLAEKEPVVIVEGPVSVLRDRKIPPLKARSNPLLGVEGCWHYRPLHFPERLRGIGRMLHMINRCLLKRELNQLLPRNGSRVVCFDSPIQDHLVKQLGEDLSIYLANDDKTLTVCGDSIHGELEAEKRLLSKADKVICVSEVLANTLRLRKPVEKLLPIHVLPNGYDERIFDPNMDYAEPSFLTNIPRPRILVAGHISERIDWDGIAGSSQLQREWTWIFVGPTDKGMEARVTTSLGKHRFYHPPIPVHDLPAWIYYCDACSVPYRLNPFTRASSPLKAIEYLAMGAPVLSTRVPSLERYREAIEWVNEGDGESYARALDRFADQAGRQEIRELRQRAVSGDSWGDRVNQFREIVFNAIS